MTPEQEKKLNDLWRIVVEGDGKDTPSMRQTVFKMDKTMAQIKNILVGIVIGLVVGGVIFFSLSLKDVIQFLK